PADVPDRPAPRRGRRPARPGRVGSRPGEGGAPLMIDLALKMLLDEKARFAATVLGVGFAAALALVQVGLSFALPETPTTTIARRDAALWIPARNTPNVALGTPSPESYVQRVGSTPGVARADTLMVGYAFFALPTGGKGPVVYWGLEDSPAW